MHNINQNISVMIAGASGLIGHSALVQLLSDNNVTSIHALVRRSLNMTDTKLVEHQNSTLSLTQWDDNTEPPELGLICLGTTLKDAGSKQALSHIDYDLVCQVAHAMKLVGTKRLAVVSSVGAHPHSPSHYLRCKGKMEQALRGLGFERLVIVRPGPLSGERTKPRRGEIISEKLLSLARPLLIGPFTNFRPISGDDVATAMLYSLLQTDSDFGGTTQVLDSKKMWALLNKYR
ncbi:NAD(P)H-binding protein [Vibrio tapetis]|uniref:NAD(P)-binding protein n=1 Tax=Vibrio tapetis subsp. tapetis TaxID=1671868 RepID=A0A2N8Z9B5_9VIBR|nr:NAD(P)H-binding protein [Vibrio tapetis]SON48477.1 NAD(P)-binding protein [Vibrio tapetis subsp. tapetis]